MSQRKAYKPSHGLGTVKYLKSGTLHYSAQISVGTKIDKNGKKQSVYRQIGRFSTKSEAEKALLEFNENPYDLNHQIQTFDNLYQKWSQDYFISLSGKSSIRTITAAYKYCHLLYNVPIRDIGVGHIKDVMQHGYVLVEDEKEKIHFLKNRFSFFGSIILRFDLPIWF